MRTYPVIDFEDDPAGKLAEFAVNTTYDDIPDDLKERTKQALLDTLAVIIGGTARPSSVAAAELTTRWQDQAADGVVFVYGYKCPAPIAALANGSFARALDYGDCDIVGGHLSEHIVPTLLTAAKLGDKPFSGKDFITAYAVGAEWGTRHHGAYNFHHHTTAMPADMGWVQSITALAKIMGLNKQQYWDAVGLQFTASSMSTNQKNNEGTEGARLSHGFISSTGIPCVLWAKAGMSGVHALYLGEAGVLRQVQWDDVDVDYLTRDLGKVWEWNKGNNLTIKPYSACKFTHSCIYCASRIRDLYKPDPDKVKEIHCIVSPSTGPVTQPTRWEPKDVGAAMFSIPYTVVHSLINGDVQLGDFSDEEIHDPRKVALMKKVTVEIDENREIFNGFTVEVTMEDGTKYTYTDDGFPGSEKNPMSWEQIEEKFWKCVPFAARPLPDVKLNALIEQCRHLEEIEDISEIVENLIP